MLHRWKFCHVTKNTFLQVWVMDIFSWLLVFLGQLRFLHIAVFFCCLCWVFFTIKDMRNWNGRSDGVHCHVWTARRTRYRVKENGTLQLRGKGFSSWENHFRWLHIWGKTSISSSISLQKKELLHLWSYNLILKRTWVRNYSQQAWTDLPIELSVAVKFHCGQVCCSWLLCGNKWSCLLRSSGSESQFSASRGSRIESHQVNTTCNHLRVGAVISSGIGPQGKFQWFVCFPWSFLRIFHLRERKSSRMGKSYTLWVWVGSLLAKWDVTPWKQVQHVLHLLFWALKICFLLGLMCLVLGLLHILY